MDIYGLPDAGRTYIVEERRADSDKWLEMPGSDKPIMSPTEADYLAAGWVKYVEPVINQETQKRGAVSISATTYTYLAADKTADELADDRAILDRQEIIDFKKASPELLALLKDTDQDIIDDIATETAGATNPVIVAGIRAAQAKTRLMLRDLTKVIKAMVT